MICPLGSVQVVEAVRLLEEFGNCDMASNTNASRFGLMIAVELDHQSSAVSTRLDHFGFEQV